MGNNYLDLRNYGKGTVTPAPNSIPLSPEGSNYINDGWLGPNIARLSDIGEGGDGVTTRRYLDVYAVSTAPLPAHAIDGGDDDPIVYTASSSGALTLDGVSLEGLAGQRALVAFETDPGQNGVFMVNDGGSVGTPWIMTRVYDNVFDNWANDSIDIFRARFGDTFAGQFFTYQEGAYLFKVLNQPLIENPTNVSGTANIHLYRQHYVDDSGTFTPIVPPFKTGVIPEPRFGIKVLTDLVDTTLNAGDGCLIQSPYGGELDVDTDLSARAGSYFEWVGRVEMIAPGEGDPVATLVWYCTVNNVPTTFVTTSPPGVSYITSNTTASPNAMYITDTTAGVITITLPPASSVSNTYPVVVKRQTGPNDVVIVTSGGDTIDGDPSLTLTVPNEWATLLSTGTEWVQIS